MKYRGHNYNSQVKHTLLSFTHWWFVKGFVRTDMEARIEELENIPNFEVDDEPGNAAQYIIDRIQELKASLKKGTR